MGNWNEPIESKDEKDLKQIAVDMYDNKLFSSLFVNDMDQNVLPMIFMPLRFMGPTPPEDPAPPNENPSSVLDNRENNLYEMVDREDDEKRFEEEMEQYEKDVVDYKKKYIPSIGMIYEYYGESDSPRSINGYPGFFSMRLLNREDTAKVIEFYSKYKEKREDLDTSF